MNLRVKSLHFDVGIQALGGNMSVSNGAATGGAKLAESIVRVAGGYLVGWHGRLYVIPDARITAAEVEDAEKYEAEQEKQRQAEAERAAAVAQLEQDRVAQRQREEQALANAKPGEVVLVNGQYMRMVDPAAQPVVVPAPDGAEPPPAQDGAVTHKMQRTGGRRGARAEPAE